MYTCRETEVQDLNAKLYNPVRVAMECNVERNLAEEVNVFQTIKPIFEKGWKKSAETLGRIIEGAKKQEIRPPELLDSFIQYIKDHQESAEKYGGWGIHAALHRSIEKRLGKEIAAAIMLAKYLIAGGNEMKEVGLQVAIDTVVTYIMNSPRFEGDDETASHGRRIVIEACMAGVLSYGLKNYGNWDTIDKFWPAFYSIFPTAKPFLTILKPGAYEGTISLATTIYRLYLSVSKGTTEHLVTQGLSLALEALNMSPLSFAVGLLVGTGACAAHAALERGEGKRLLMMRLYKKNFIDQCATEELEKLPTETIILSMLEAAATVTNPLRGLYLSLIHI